MLIQLLWLNSNSTLSNKHVPVLQFQLGECLHSSFSVHMEGLLTSALRLPQLRGVSQLAGVCWSQWNAWTSWENFYWWRLPMSPQVPGHGWNLQALLAADGWEKRPTWTTEVSSAMGTVFLHHGVRENWWVPTESHHPEKEGMCQVAWQWNHIISKESFLSSLAFEGHVMETFVKPPEERKILSKTP